MVSLSAYCTLTVHFRCTCTCILHVVGEEEGFLLISLHTGLASWIASVVQTSANSGQLNLALLSASDVHVHVLYMYTMCLYTCTLALNFRSHVVQVVSSYNLPESR